MLSRRASGGASRNVGEVRSLVVTLLQSVAETHAMHLQSRSFSQHMALEGYYTAVDKLVDSLVEAYQGGNELLEGYSVHTDPVAYLRKIRGEVEARRRFFPGSSLQNIIDTIVELVDSTLYKLRFLS